MDRLTTLALKALEPWALTEEQIYERPVKYAENKVPPQSMIGYWLRRVLREIKKEGRSPRY